MREAPRQVAAKILGVAASELDEDAGVVGLVRATAAALEGAPEGSAVTLLGRADGRLVAVAVPPGVSCGLAALVGSS